MALDLRECTPFGSALPEPFLHDLIEHELIRRELLPGLTGEAGRRLEEDWDFLRRKLRALGGQGGDRRVASHILEPLGRRLGYPVMERQGEVPTREGAEDGGWLLKDEAGHQLRVWALAVGQDLDAPNRRGRAYRFSPGRATQRVLLAAGERVGLLTNGEELRLLLCDPARPDSHLSISLEGSGGWRGARRPPDSFRLLKALAAPAGLAALSEILEAARLAQSTVTKQLREQARAAVEGFLQGVLEHPDNAAARAGWTDLDATARELWREGLVMVYRLLFVFKLEASPDPARAFSFATTSPWRNTYSPNLALAPLAQAVLLEGKDTGGYLEASLRALWRMFSHGISSNELSVKALGGALFGEQATPLLDGLKWGDEAVARLLVALLWTPGRRGEQPRHVHYGALDVEDLGRVYEALLELEPGISSQPMCRLRRAKLEVVVSLVQGAPYRAATAPAPTAATAEDEAEEDEDLEEEDEGEEAPVRRGRGANGGTRVQFIEEIPAGRFHLRVGLGRKASGSYYTPHPFVRFLVQETLGPQLAQRSARENPQPAAILTLKVLDPAMGSGHFLVEACRYLGEALYEACRLCDELAVQAEEEAEQAGEETARDELLARANALRRRVQALPDPEDALLAYLPSRVTEGESSGLSQRKAEAMCRRLVAVHCLYGVDKNPLAAELAKLSLWLESYAEGLPLTFLDHRLLCGDSLTGPFVEHLLTLPKSGAPLDNLFAQGLETRLRATLATALARVGELEASVGTDVADLERKRLAKAALDAALQPFKTLAAAWSGGVMLGEAADNAAYQALAAAVAAGEDPAPVLAGRPRLREMAALGADGVPFELVLPEVFHPDGEGRKGFDAVLGNPPWDAIQFKSKEFLAAFNLAILDAPTRRERTLVESQLLADVSIAQLFAQYQEDFEEIKRCNDRLYQYQKVIIDGDLAGRQLDAFRVFMERNAQLLAQGGLTGVVVPSAFHANAGATGIRQLYLERMSLRCCLSFVNRRKLFEIHSSQKFAAVVARRDSTTTDGIACGFHWQELGQLFETDGRLFYSLEFIRKTGGDYLSFLELSSEEDATAAGVMFTELFLSTVLEEGAIRLGSECHMRNDSHRFTPSLDILPAGLDSRDPDVTTSLIERGFLSLHEGKTYHQFDDHWEAPPRYLVAVTALVDKPAWLKAACHFRLAFRDIASSTNERTSIFALLPPGVVFGHTAPCEREPQNRRTASALAFQAVANSHPFDWSIRVKTASHVSLFILCACPFPALSANAERFLSHHALRLSCNHAGYAPLWEEQLGEAWHEPTPPHTWPVLVGDEARWALRAALDAAVAQAYGLDRGQYAHVLSTFSHRSFPRAPELCLAAFDELQEIGLEAFCQKHDPYWDIPLNESLPRPVIDLPIPGETETLPGSPEQGHLFRDTAQGQLFGGDAAPRRGRRPRAARVAPVPARPAGVAGVEAVAGDAHAGEAQAGDAVGVRPQGEAWRLLCELLARRGEITSTDAQAATGLDATGVRPLLQRLVTEGLATQEGQRRGTRYRRIEGGSPP